MTSPGPGRGWRPWNDVEIEICGHGQVAIRLAVEKCDERRVEKHLREIGSAGFGTASTTARRTLRLLSTRIRE